MNKPIIIIWSITISICAAIGYFIMYPNITNGLKTYNSTKQINEELTNSTQRKKVLTDLSKNNDLAGLTKIATSYIPEDSMAAELILELSGIAKNAGVEVDQLSFSNKTSTPSSGPGPGADPSMGEGPMGAAAVGMVSGNTEEVGFQMTISGGFDSIIKFLSLSEVSARLTSIQSISLSEDKLGGKTSAQISGSGYWKKATIMQASDTSSVMITAETIQKLKSLTQNSEPVNTTTEEGFGRANPFDAIN